MFTGIIRSKAKVINTKQNKGILAVSVTLPSWSVKLGESISVNGICTTVARKAKSEIGFDYMPETLRKSNVADWKLGDIVNLERSLRHGDPIDGHFVTGHVDAVGVVTKIKSESKSRVLSVSIPKDLQHYIVYKGSVTLDGVALTVSKKVRDGFEVSLIPYTLNNTNLDKLKAGDRVNVECDIIAKYLYAKKTKAPLKRSLIKGRI